MDTQEFLSIKDKIESLKSKKAKAEGAVEAIMKEWEHLYNARSLEEVEKILDDKKKEQEENEEKISFLYSELKGLTNWNLV